MPSIIKRGNAYRIFVSLKSDGTGKPVRKTVTYHPPKDITEKKARFLAEAYAYKLEEQLRYYSDMNDSVKFSELCSWYFDTIAPNRVKERTLVNNRKLVENYVIPRIGNLKLKDITPYRIDGMITELFMHGSLKDRGPLKAGTVNLVRAAASTVFSTAVKKGILAKNPVEGSTPLKAQETERAFLTDESGKLLLERLDTIRSEQVRNAIIILLYTGLRRGELLALHWRDVNFVRAEITVRFTLYRSAGRVRVTSPKTRASNRIVPVPETVTETLMEQLAFVERLKKAAGHEWKDTDAVFVNHHGDYMNGEYLNNMFKKFLRENGFPPMHIHDLRHANASILINRGVPMKIVSEHLGHTSEKTTEEFYTHMFGRSRQITASVIENALSDGEDGAEADIMQFRQV